MKHYVAIGLYNDPMLGGDQMAFIHDDMGNLVPITMEQFDQHIYFRTGRMP